MPAYEIFLDESCKDDHRYLMIGGIIVESKDMEVLNNTILELKTQKGCVDELKWVKTNDYRYKSYCQIVDKFFELNNSALFCFHSLTIDQHKVNHSKYNDGSPEIGFSKFIYQLLVNKFGRIYGGNGIFRVHLDERTTTSSLDLFKDILNNGIAKRYGLIHRPFRRVQFRKSKKTPILQFNDIVLGAIAIRRNEHQLIPGYRKSKIDLSQRVLEHAEIKDITNDTPIQQRKFSIWNLGLGK